MGQKLIGLSFNPHFNCEDKCIRVKEKEESFWGNKRNVKIVKEALIWFLVSALVAGCFIFPPGAPLFFLVIKLVSAFSIVVQGCLAGVVVLSYVACIAAIIVMDNREEKLSREVKNLEASCASTKADTMKKNASTQSVVTGNQNSLSDSMTEEEFLDLFYGRELTESEIQQLRQEEYNKSLQALKSTQNQGEPIIVEKQIVEEQIEQVLIKLR